MSKGYTKEVIDILDSVLGQAIINAYEVGAEEEQARIIKLLEASARAWSDDCAAPVDWKHCQNCWQIGSLIASIKGENK